MYLPSFLVSRSHLDGRFQPYTTWKTKCVQLIPTLYGQKRPYKGGLNLNIDDFSLFWGGFAVILPVFSCEMGVKIFYMPLFKPKRGGLELGRGSSKSNRINTSIINVSNAINNISLLNLSQNYW